VTRQGHRKSRVCHIEPAVPSTGREFVSQASRNGCTHGLPVFNCRKSQKGIIDMEKKTIALIFGGISSEREVSLNSGKQVFEALDKNKYDIVTYDPKTDIPRLVNDAERIDCALIILHGPYGEDGTVQGLLDLLDIPYQGAGVLGSAVAMNKLLSKGLYERAGLTVPPYAVVRRGESVDVASALSPGWDCRWWSNRWRPDPVWACPSSAPTSSLAAAVEKAMVFGATAMIEAFITGTEITCGVLGNEAVEALPLIEIIPGDDHEFFDYDAKYQPGATQEICPAPLDATADPGRPRPAPSLRTMPFIVRGTAERT
jgi:D-alanine-D-alanine ligase